MATTFKVAHSLAVAILLVATGTYRGLKPACPS